MQEEEKEISIREVVLKLLFLKDLLLSKKIIIILFTILGALALLAFTFHRKPLYKAKITFMLEESDKTMGMALSAYSGLASQLGLMGSSSEYGIENVTELIRSRRIIEDALFGIIRTGNREILLINYYLEVNKMKGKIIKGNPNYQFRNNVIRTISEEEALADIILDIQGKLVVDRTEKKSNILFIEFLDKNQYFAKELVGSVLQSLSRFYVSRKTQKAHETLKLVQSRADSIKGELERTEFMLAKVKDASNRLVKAEGYLNEGRIMRQAQILNVMYSEVIKNLEITKFSLLSQTPLFQVIDTPVLPLEKKVFLSKRAGVILGGVIGFLIASLYVIIVYYFKRNKASLS